ncbi:MAG: hypothetical protein ACKOBL_07000, partial [Chloroflexota bacterium]
GGPETVRQRGCRAEVPYAWLRIIAGGGWRLEHASCEKNTFSMGVFLFKPWVCQKRNRHSLKKYRIVSSERSPQDLDMEEVAFITRKGQKGLMTVK